MNTSWFPYALSDFFNILGLAFDIRIRYDANPISIYKIVHTIGNNHPGGDNGGLSSIENWIIHFIEIKPANPPIISGTATHKISNFNFTFISFAFYFHYIKKTTN